MLRNNFIIHESPYPIDLAKRVDLQIAKIAKLFLLNKFAKFVL